MSTAEPTVWHRFADVAGLEVIRSVVESQTISSNLSIFVVYSWLLYADAQLAINNTTHTI